MISVTFWDKDITEWVTVNYTEKEFFLKSIKEWMEYKDIHLKNTFSVEEYEKYRNQQLEMKLPFN